MKDVWNCNKKPEECPYRMDYCGCTKENCSFPHEYKQKEKYLLKDSKLGENTKLNKLLILFLVLYIVVAVVAFPDQQVMSKKLKKDSDIHFTVQFEQATGVPLYIMNKEEDIGTFDKVIKEKYPNASPYEIKLIGNTLENKGIDWQDVTGHTMEIYGEIVGVENKDKKGEFGADVVAGLRVFGSSSKEEYEKYKNGQIMVFNVSYINARAVTGLSLVVFLISPVFIIILVYLVIKFLLSIIRKHNMHIFKKTID